MERKKRKNVFSVRRLVLEALTRNGELGGNHKKFMFNNWRGVLDWDMCWRELVIHTILQSSSTWWRWWRREAYSFIFVRCFIFLDLISTWSVLNVWLLQIISLLFNFFSYFCFFHVSNIWLNVWKTTSVTENTVYKFWINVVFWIIHKPMYISDYISIPQYSILVLLLQLFHQLCIYV